MDWFSWLSKSSLEPLVVHEYSFAFAQNELEEEDISYFNHEFLQSMGISIAKHRLEILKLSQKRHHHHHQNDNDSSETTRRRVKKLLSAINKTKRCLGNYLRAWTHNNNSEKSKSALVLVKGEMLKRNKNSSFVVAKQGRLMITNGSPMVVSSGRSRVNSFSSPLVFNNNNNYYLKNSTEFEQQDHDNNINNNNNHADQDVYWSNNGVEDMRWDTLFQDLKPN